MSPRRTPSPALARVAGVLGVVVATLLLLLAGSLPAGAATADEPRRATSANPLAGHAWGVYTGGAEMAWAPYARSTGTERDLLAKIALRPKAKWFGDWISTRQIGAKVDEYIANATRGNPDVLVQMTVFRVTPWEGEACRRLPTRAEKAAYRGWIRSFAAATGNARAAIIVQPDGPFALCAPGGSPVLSRLVRFATRTFAALPRTTVYVEAGSSTWNHQDPAEAVHLLTRAGIQYARGFHLNTTHYDPTDMEVRFGARVVEALAAAGMPGKHFTVDTAQNGRGFTWEYNRAHHGGDFDHAPACATPGQDSCVTLGIPPTTDVANPAWGLPADVAQLAAQHVDAYLWAGRPWLHRQASPFDRARALAIARTTPY